MTVLITGANKGIGYQIARQFAQNNYEGKIIITARNEFLGHEALKSLKNEFPEANFVFHQLDITDFTSRRTLIDFIKSKNENLKILINNAGIAYKVNSEADFSEQAEVTNTTNYYGTKSLTIEMLDDGSIFKNNSRILMCSSLCSDTSYAKCSKTVQEGFKENIKSVSELDAIVENFIDLADKEGPVENNDELLSLYSNSAYGMSKVFVRSLACILAKTNPNINFYSYCPGWCKSDMAGWEKPPLSAEEGSKIAYWLGTSEDKIILESNGGYFRNGGKLCDWGYVDGE